MLRAAPLRRLGVLASHVAKEEERHNGSNGKQLAHDKESVGISSKDLVGAEEKLYAKGWPESLPPPQYKQVPRFPVGDVGVLQHLEDHGFVRKRLSRSRSFSKLPLLYVDDAFAGGRRRRAQPRGSLHGD